MDQQEQDNKELLVMKAELTQTTNTRGWAYILKFSETVVRELESAAIEEEDDDKARGMRRDARGARKFREELIRRIEFAKQQDFSSSFNEVATD